MKGGALNKLPARASPDSMFYVSAHGNLDGTMFVIPPNTYVMEMSAAGYPVLKDSAIMDWISIAPGSDEDKWKTYMTGKIALNEFPKKMCAATVSANAAEAAECSHDASLSVYEPGDYIANQGLYFANNSHPLMLSGLWKLPLPTKVYYDVFEYNEDYTDFLEEHPDVPASDKYNELDRYFLDKPANLLRERMFGGAGVGAGAAYKTTLANLLYSDVIPPGTEANPNIIIVHSCRSAPAFVTPVPLAPKPDLYAKRARRLSVATRRRVDSDVYLNRDFLVTVATVGLSRGLPNEEFQEAARRILARPTLVSTDDVYTILVIGQNAHATKDIFQGREFANSGIYSTLRLAESLKGGRRKRNTTRRKPRRARMSLVRLVRPKA